MAPLPTQTGRIPLKVPSIDRECETYYVVFGDLSSGVPPLVALHGGPGGSYEYLLPFAELWSQYGIPVVFYDQVGGGESTRLPETEGDKSLWAVETFVAELNNVLDHLKLRETGYHVLGHSWGGMLAAEFATRRPKGLRRLVLAGAIASWASNLEGLRVIRKNLPQEHRNAFDEAERTSNWDAPAVQEALTFLGKKHMFRGDVVPKELVDVFPKLSATVRNTMMGPQWISPRLDCTFHHWTSVPRLPEVEVQTLVYQGEFDSSAEPTTLPFFEHIPKVRYITFVNSGHFPHLEDGLREKVFRTVGDFLAQK